MRRRFLVSFAVMGGLFLLTAMLVSFAESKVASQIEQQLVADFPTLVVDEVEIAGIFPLIQGEIASISMHADEYVTESNGEPVRLHDLEVSLRMVSIDFGAAISGTLDRVDVLFSEVRGSLPLDTVTTMVGTELDGGTSGFRLVSLVPDGASFVITVGLPDGQQHTVTMRPAFLGDAFQLIPAERASPDDTVRDGVRRALSDLRLSLGALPLGLTIDDVTRVATDHLELAGRLPQTIVFS